MCIYERMRELGIELPPAPQRGGLYTPVIEFGNKLLYCSGCTPRIGTDQIYGKLGKELSVEEGQIAARRCMLNILSNLHAKIGDLNRIKQFVKVLGFVNCTDDFTMHPQVINGGSQVLLDIFGEKIGLPARTAVGTNALPGNVAVEIELLAEYE